MEANPGVIDFKWWARHLIKINNIWIGFHKGAYQYSGKGSVPIQDPVQDALGSVTGLHL